MGKYRRAEEERARVWPPAGARPREDGPPVTQPVRAAVLAAQRTVGNTTVARTVQRLTTEAGENVPLKTQSGAFLLDMLKSVPKPPGRFTREGVGYLVSAKDVEVGKRLVMEKLKESMLKEKVKATKYRTYEEYVAALGLWEGKHKKRADVALKVGQPLYHGTTRDVALKVKKKGLSPAEPSFRGGVWDASKDGYLSMATTTGGVTLSPDPVILRMVVAAGDRVVWHWKPVGGKDEVVSMVGIPAARLEWIVPVKGWDAEGAKWSAMADLA